MIVYGTLKMRKKVIMTVVYQKAKKQLNIEMGQTKSFFQSRLISLATYVINDQLIFCRRFI